MTKSQLPRLVPRPVPEGTVPLIAVEGAAYDCGREYAEIVLRGYPGFREYLDHAASWQNLNGEARKLVERDAPHLIDVFRGIFAVAGPAQAPPPPPPKSACTGFSLSPEATLDGHPISGQSKDTPLNRVPRYIVLRMRIKGAPTILTLAYPGEVLGYGMWSNGMTLTRHTMFARGGSRPGLPGGVLPYVCLACGSADKAVELYRQYAGGGPAGMMYSDATGRSAAIDVTRSGIGVRYPVDGVLTRSNHPESPECAADEEYPDVTTGDDSKYRTRGLFKLFHAERGRLSAVKAVQIMADHTMYPGGPCKHWSDNGDVTTCLYVAEPTRGRIHVVRGQPCCNWPVTYTI